MTLPPPVVAALNLPYVMTLQAALANRGRGTIAVFAAPCFGTARRTTSKWNAPPVAAFGTGLLEGHDLRIRMKPSGPVEIEAIP